MVSTNRIGHWLPIITFCPVNNLPDFVYIYVTFENEFQELYSVRKNIRKLIQFKKLFMEDIAQKIIEIYPTCTEVSVVLLTGRHVTTTRNNYVSSN